MMNQDRDTEREEKSRLYLVLCSPSTGQLCEMSAEIFLPMYRG
jgi:hypothetical protein